MPLAFDMIIYRIVTIKCIKSLGACWCWITAACVVWWWMVDAGCARCEHELVTVPLSSAPATATGQGHARGGRWSLRPVLSGITTKIFYTTKYMFRQNLYAVYISWHQDLGPCHLTCTVRPCHNITAALCLLGPVIYCLTAVCTQYCTVLYTVLYTAGQVQHWDRTMTQHVWYWGHLQLTALHLHILNLNIFKNYYAIIFSWHKYIYAN